MTNAQFFTAVSAQTTANTAIRFFVGLSVAFGIASVMAVVVVQKSSEIGILRAMGISQGQIMRLFLLQGGVLALAGSMAGSAIGAGVLMLWQRAGAQRRRDAALCARAGAGGCSSPPLLLAALTGLRRGICAGSYAPRGSTRWWRSVADGTLRNARPRRVSDESRPVVVELRDVHKAYNVGTPIETEVLHGIDLMLRRGRVLRADGAVGIGQEHAAQHHRAARPANVGRACQFAAQRRPASTTAT